jgi:hypothetical protein
MTVVRGCAQKEPVVEARSEVANGPSDIRIRRVLARRGGGSDMRFVQDQQPLASTLPKVVEERITILRTT